MGYVRTTGRDRIHWCRCGAIATELPAWHYRHGVIQQWNEAYTAWSALHTGAGHRIEADDWRALCRPALAGCRQCGATPTGRFRFYCSAECHETFERNHFWGRARSWAITTMTTYAVTASHDYRGRVVHRPDGTRCVRCAEVCVPEVNHIVPVNGRRPMFGCEHHQENLEVLCHRCHLDVTAEQRRSGLIGKGAA